MSAPVLPELNEFYRLTNADHMIFRRRMSVQAQGRYHVADRRDAQVMRQATLDAVVFFESIRLT